MATPSQETMFNKLYGKKNCGPPYTQPIDKFIFRYRDYPDSNIQIMKELGVVVPKGIDSYQYLLESLPYYNELTSKSNAAKTTSNATDKEIIKSLGVIPPYHNRKQLERHSTFLTNGGRGIFLPRKCPRSENMIGIGTLDSYVCLSPHEFYEYLFDTEEKLSPINAEQLGLFLKRKIFSNSEEEVLQKIMDGDLDIPMDFQSEEKRMPSPLEEKSEYDLLVENYERELEDLKLERQRLDEDAEDLERLISSISLSPNMSQEEIEALQ